MWRTTLHTFMSKMFFASSFLVPFLFLEIKTATTISLVYGFTLIIGYSCQIAKNNNKEPFPVIFEHIMISLFTYFAGKLVQIIYISS